MGIATGFLEKVKNSLPISRRGFIKSAVALGAISSVYGCSKDDGETIIYSSDDGIDAPDLTADKLVYGTGTHNCGSRCLSIAHVKNGRIIRITTDETKYVDDVMENPDSYNNTQSRNCSKCRSYKYRIYHPGRLKYPMKQTKKRGDLTGFVRISWEQALNEIARKHKAILGKYGPEAISFMYATANQNNLQRLWRYSSASIAGNFLGGNSTSLFSYSTHQWNFLGTNHIGYGPFDGEANAADIAGVVKNAVLFGSNGFSTRNHTSNGEVHALRDLRKRGGKVYFIAPEFVDNGVATATEWVQTKPFTDGALFMAMMYEMLINTFDDNGNIKANPWIDVDYIDTVLYGFFDSPAYWVNTKGAGAGNLGDITLTDPVDTTNWKKVNEVPDGKSLSAYIMGSDNRLTKAKYSDGSTYIAKTFSTEGTTSNRTRNKATCSYNVPASTKYKTKEYMKLPKTPEWAEKVTGIPAAKIRELAELYARPANHPIYTEWSGGQQKQADGVATLFAMQAMLIVSKTYGQTGDTMAWVGTKGPLFADNETDREELPAPDTIRDAGNLTGIKAHSIIAADLPKSLKTPTPSCISWYNGIKFAFGDVLKTNGYTGKYLPDWNTLTGFTGEKGEVHCDDGGAKAFVKMKRDTNGNLLTYPDDTGNEYYDWEGRTGTDGTSAAHTGTPVYSGYRFMINEGGNILMNQHENPNDTREMMECLPIITNPDNPDDFCFVALDNFLSPTPRWADYVLPGATNWEQEQAECVSTGTYIFIPVASNPPGEAKSCRDFTIEFLRAYEKLDPSKAGMAQKYIGRDSATDKFKDEDSYYEKHRRAYEKSNVQTTPTSRFYGKSFENALKVQYQTRTPSTALPTATVTKNAFRIAVETYLADTDRATKPFYYVGTVGAVPNTELINTKGNTYGYGNEYPTEIAKTEPETSGRACVYQERMVFQYEHRFEKWHGYLVQSGKQGQKNRDLENDPIVYPIPLYYAYEDYFMEAYGGADKLSELKFLLTTTHDHHRVHSTHSENPLLRELTHRTRGGKLYSGNDWGSYALSAPENGAIPRLNKAIQQKLPTATWSEIWMNADDGARMGINDGDLLKVSNPVGAVRVIARLTQRCVPGYLSLHQGCWYDPDPVDGVDDGGNCNTLMASKPSRIDNGNGQQSAMVKVERV